MKAIFTKHLPATNTKPARIKAYAEGGNSLTISYDFDGNGHAAAARAPCKTMGWTGTLVAGGRPDNKGEVFCFLGSDHHAI